MESYEFGVIKAGFEQIIQQLIVANQIQNNIHKELVKMNAGKKPVKKKTRRK